MDFVVGQRWVSHTEAQLGLGIISAVADRLITLNFPAVEEERSYAATNAPLSRVVYKEGDTINTMDLRTLVIEEVLENGGHFIYFGIDEAGSVVLSNEPFVCGRLCQFVVEGFETSLGRK